MIKQVIINADDFGLTSDVSRAIVEAYRNGIVTSTTLLGNCADELLEQAEELSRQNPGLGIGAHLVLTTRRPILDTHQTLVNEAGNFKYRPDTLDDNISTDEVYHEWKAQLNRLKERVKITHIDSHHHVHMREKLFPVALALSKEFSLPMRAEKEKLPYRIKVDTGFYDDNVSVAYLINAMTNQEGLIEIMVHPGYESDVFLQEISSYVSPRQKELEVLMSEEVKVFMRDNNIKGVNYGNFNK